MAILTSGSYRLWLFEDGARIDRPPLYEGRAVVSDVSYALGDIAYHSLPVTQKEHQFRTYDSSRSAPDGVTFTISRLYRGEGSNFLSLSRGTRRFDLQLHVGRCSTPQDFNQWEKIIAVEQCHITAYELTGVGAAKTGDRAATQEIITITGRVLYEILPVSATCQEYDDGFGVFQNGLDIAVSGFSDQEKRAAFVTGRGTGFPSATRSLWLTTDGFESATQMTLHSSVFGTEIAGLTAVTNDMSVAFAGDYVYVSAQRTGRVIRARFEELLDTGGALSLWEPVDVYSPSAVGFTTYRGGVSSIETMTAHSVYAVGEHGFVFRIDEAKPVVLTGGFPDLTLNDVAVISTEDIVACGLGGTLLLTEDGGESWKQITSAPLFDFTAVCYHSHNTIIVAGVSDYLHYTTDKGKTWNYHPNVFQSLTTTPIADVKFASRFVGYVVGRSNLKLWRTTDGGWSWQEIPIAYPAGVLGLKRLEIGWDVNTAFVSGEVGGLPYITSIKPV